MKQYIAFLLLTGWLILVINCRRDAVIATSKFKTENIIIILIDGPRYSETWGEGTHQYIPGLDLISKEGIVCTDFYNEGTTNTVNGHAAITTGFYENLNNGGSEIPTHPSLFQLYLENRETPSTDAWMIGSKDKLQVLGDCNDSTYKGHYNPSTDCGVNGLFTGYREDSVTFKNAVATLATLHPHFAFISFKQPDSYAHANDWNNYLISLKQSDNYVFQLWKYIQNDPQYKNKTTLFVTNDHGRHLDGVADGFVSHGDGCAGCRHIMLLAVGPDFKRNTTVTDHYGLTDINATICYLFGLQNQGKGKVINTLFK